MKVEVTIKDDMLVLEVEGRDVAAAHDVDEYEGFLDSVAEYGDDVTYDPALEDASLVTDNEKTIMMAEWIEAGHAWVPDFYDGSH